MSRTLTIMVLSLLLAALASSWSTCSAWTPPQPTPRPPQPRPPQPPPPAAAAAAAAAAKEQEQERHHHHQQQMRRSRPQQGPPADTTGIADDARRKTTRQRPQRTATSNTARSSSSSTSTSSTSTSTSTSTRASSIRRSSLGAYTATRLRQHNKEEEESTSSSTIAVGTTTRRDLFRSSVYCSASSLLMMIPLLVVLSPSWATSPATATATATAAASAAAAAEKEDEYVQTTTTSSEVVVVVAPIPRVTNEITHVAQITYSVGERREEIGFLRIGLYGKDCPNSVKQFLQFLGSSTGLTTLMSDDQRLRDSIGMRTAPVGLIQGGIVPNICAGTAVEWGVPSQAKAYAAARGMRSAGPDFVPQPRPPNPALISDEIFPRPHNVAGLVSIPAKGIGYGNDDDDDNDDDQAYALAFLLTADAIPSFDGNNGKNSTASTSSNKKSSTKQSPPKRLRRRVIGQVIDDASMKNLARLASLPIQKKQSLTEGAMSAAGLRSNNNNMASGPPLLKVTVQDIGVQKVLVQ